MDQLFGHILNMSITGSYVIVFIIVARLFLRKVPKIFSYALWSVVLFRLLCPFSIESIFSFIPSEVQNTPLNKQFTQMPQIQEVINTSDQAVNHISTVLVPTEPATSAVITPANSTDAWINIGHFIWLIGIALLFIYSIVATVRLSRNLRTATLLLKIYTSIAALPHHLYSAYLSLEFIFRADSPLMKKLISSNMSKCIFKGTIIL